jgi:hypothetical protein
VIIGSRRVAPPAPAAYVIEHEPSFAHQAFLLDSTVNLWMSQQNLDLDSGILEAECQP